MAEAPPLSSFAHPRYWPTWLGAGLLRALSWLPLPILAFLGAGLGMLLYALHKPRRDIVRTNVVRCFPKLSDGMHERMVRRHFRAFGQSVLDVGIAWWAGRRRLRRVVRLRDRHHYDEALRARRNIILLAPHFIGLEMGGNRIAADLPVVSVFNRVNNELLRALMLRARTRFGAVLIEYNRPFKSLVRAVKSGTPLYYLPDQDPGQRHSVFAPFFGIPTATFAALGRLAQMTDAVVIPCVTYQRRWGFGYEVVFHPPLADFPSGDSVADTSVMNAAIEAAVVIHPEQYFWLHKRFKTRPPGEPKFY